MRPATKLFDRDCEISRWLQHLTPLANGRIVAHPTLPS